MNKSLLIILLFALVGILSVTQTYAGAAAAGGFVSGAMKGADIYGQWRKKGCCNLRLSLLNECCQDYDCPILGRVC
jgi:hypothetical protein